MDRRSQPIRLAILSHRFQRNDGQGRVNFEVANAALQSSYHVTIVATACSEELSSHPRCRFAKIGYFNCPPNCCETWSLHRAAHGGSAHIVMSSTSSRQTAL